MQGTQGETATRSTLAGATRREELKPVLREALVGNRNGQDVTFALQQQTSYTEENKAVNYVLHNGVHDIPHGVLCTF
jgi:hypothetical protein